MSGLMAASNCTPCLTHSTDSCRQRVCVESETLTIPMVRVVLAATAKLVQHGTGKPSRFASNSAPVSATTAAAWNFSVGPAETLQT